MQIKMHKPVTVNKQDDEWIEIVDAKSETVVMRMVEDIEYIDEEMATMQHIADAINAYKG